MSKYWAVELCLAVSVQHLKLGHRIALASRRLIGKQASGDEMQCTATPVQGRWVERFNKWIRCIDCQFVNEDAEAQGMPWKRAAVHH